MSAEDMTYSEALELAAALYTGARLTEMALHGYPQYELPRVPEADRPATEAMLADLKADSKAITAVTRRGRDEWPASLRAVPQGAGLLGW